MLTMDLIKLVLHLNLFWINSGFFGASVVKVISVGSEAETNICLHTETENRCPTFEGKVDKIEILRGSKMLFMNFTDRACSHPSITIVIQKFNLDWVCLVSKINEIDGEAYSLVLLSCNTGIISHDCEQQDLLTNSLCSKSALENTSLECNEISLTGPSETVVCTQYFWIDDCQNRVETSTMNTEGLLAFILQSPTEVAACACAAFIVVTFFIALCIPEHKCRPAYSDNSHNTVPYRIYKIYGARGRRGHINFGMKLDDGIASGPKQQTETGYDIPIQQDYLTVTIDTERRNSIC